MDDGYYNVDTTWDDTGSGTYDYFNKTDEDYAGNHIRQELSVYLPLCNGQAYRNLEQKDDDNDLRSLADVGMAEEQVITDMQAYMEKAMTEIGASSCEMALGTEQLQGGRYLIKHEVSVR